MKRIFLAAIFACFTLAVSAQDVIRVNFQGQSPDISDFVWSFLNGHVDEEGCADEATNAVKEAWTRYRQGRQQEEDVTVTVDKRNGYAVYESRQGIHYIKTEMCYWNESDGRHKLFAYCNSLFTNGKCTPGQFDCLLFYRYDSATKKMTYCNDNVGFEVVYGEGSSPISYDLPRVGKDIIVNVWHESGKKQKTLKWNGRRFSYQITH